MFGSLSYATHQSVLDILEISCSIGWKKSVNLLCVHWASSFCNLGAILVCVCWVGAWKSVDGVAVVDGLGGVGMGWWVVV